MHATPKAVIRVEDLTKKFDGFTAVDRIQFNVYDGEIFGFLGPNGSGKTTTIRMMLNLLPPTSGEIEVLGFPVTQHTREIQPRVGYMSQHFSLYNDLSVLQNLRFYGQSYGLKNDLLRSRIEEALEMSDLGHHRKTPTRELSGGWRQRLALSAAILHRPDLLFLDEPTAGVDPVSRREFWDLLYTFVEQGITVFITTHYMDEAEHCHRLAFLQRGRIIARGSPQEFKSTIMKGDVLELKTSDAARTIKRLRHALQQETLPIQDIQLYGTLVHITGPRLRQHIRKIRKLLKKEGIDVDSIQAIEPSLEDVFIASMRESEKEVTDDE